MRYLSILLLVPVCLLPGPAFSQSGAVPEIIIEGADDALAANIRDLLRVGAEPCDTSRGRLGRLLPQVRGNVQSAGNALGYYRMTFTAAFSEGENCWRLTLDVTPGERIPVNEVSINIAGDDATRADFADVLEGLPDLQDRPLHQGEYESVKNTLSARAVEDGYFSARFRRSEIRLDLTAYRAAILIDFEPGPRYRIGELRIQPLPHFSERFINSLIILHTGEPYSSERLLAQRTRLDESLYFQQINVSPQLSQARNLSVPILIELTPRPRHAWSTGVGLTTDTGPRVRASYENRYINRRGHRLDGDAAASPVRSQVNLGYVIPLDDPLTTSLNINGGVITENTDTFDSDRLKLETSYQRESPSGWMESYSVDYLRDDYVVDLQKDTSTLTMLGYSLSKTAADDLISPSRGWRLFGQVRGAMDSILSDTSFIQLYGSGKGIMPLGRGRFITRFEAGATWIDRAEELPASVRFFAGGDQSLRGYKYRSLGPVNVNGEVIGGKHLLTGSLEYELPVKNNWRTAFFYDGGNAFSDEKFDWKHSVGVGLRWLSPIGPVRVDIAHPLDGSGGVRLHITMGPDL